MSASIALLLSILTFVELNCENLFDTEHDTLKQDTEYLPDSPRRWTPKRYWKKLDNMSRAILACGRSNDDDEWSLPALVALCEVENDSVVRDLTRRSLLREAGYEYVVTSSPDVRGIDVALLYSPLAFALINSYPLRVEPLDNMRPTRDILYASGRLANGDTLHVFVVHAPSRYGGERPTRPHRLRVMERLKTSLDSLRSIDAEARVIVAGDFNDYDDSPSLTFLAEHCSLTDVSAGARGSHGAEATYKYEGLWRSLDHILAGGRMTSLLLDCRVQDDTFLLEEDSRYGGIKPLRTYYGYRYLGGFSDHLPLVARFNIQPRAAYVTP